MSQNIKDKANKVANKAKQTASKMGKTVVENPKTTGYVVAGVIALILGYSVYKGIKNKINPDIDDDVDGVGGLPDPNQTTATITQTQAINYASQLLEAMNYMRNSWFFGGTDEDTINQVFDQLNSGNDFVLVFHAFGEKEYNGFNSPVEGSEWLDSSYEKKDLVYWLKSELSYAFEPTIFNKVKQRVESAGFVF
jgi:hypothetical protein